MEGNGSYRACFLRKQPRGGHPLSLLTTFAASSPKGTPLCYAGNLAAATKSRPLGEGGLTRSGKTEGVLPGTRPLVHHAAMTERVFLNSHFFYQSVTFRFVLFVVYYGQHGSPWQH